MIKTYRKIATIQAEQFDASARQVHKYPIRFTSWQTPNEFNEYEAVEQSGWQLETLEGNLTLQIGDWIATGVNGEHWAIANDIFKKTYVELPVIPKYVAEYINQMKLEGKSLGDAFKYWLREDDIDEYMEDNSEKFAQAWLDGYQIEVDK